VGNGGLVVACLGFFQMRLTVQEAVAMHLRIYRDESRSGHLDLVGEGDHPWTIDLVVVTTAATLVVGFVIALMAQLVR
jgi:hypothetical protein